MAEVGSIEFAYLYGVVNRPRMHTERWLEPGRDGTPTRKDASRARPSRLLGIIYEDSMSLARSTRDDVLALAGTVQDIRDEHDELHEDVTIEAVELRQQIRPVYRDGEEVYEVQFDITATVQADA